MVKNSEMPEMGAYAKAVAQAVRDAIAAAGVSSVKLGAHLGRAQSYASTRLQGRRAWTTDEIDQIATLLGIPLDAIWEAAKKYR